MSEPVANQPLKNVLLDRNFLLFVQGGWISQLGTQIALVATAYWIKSATDSASLLGLLATTSAIPVLILSPVAGAVADRCSKRDTLIVWDVLGAIISFFFLFLIGSQVFSLNQKLAGIFFGNLVLSAGGAFAGVVCSTLLPELVHRDYLSKAMAFTQAFGLIAIIAGQALAGLLLARTQPHVMFGIDGTSYVISAIGLSFIRLSTVFRARAAGNLWKSVWSEIGEGLVYAWGTRGLRVLILATFPISLFTSPVLVFLPFYTTNTLHEPLARYGYLLSMISVGVLCGFILGGRFTPRPERVHGALFGSIGVNAILIFALSTLRWFWVAMPVFFVSGILTGIMLLLSSSAVMLKIDADKRGRVSGILFMIAQGITPLAMSLIGMVGDRISGQVHILYGAFGILLFVSVVVLYLNRDLRLFLASDPPVAQA